ncbi:hypothetical protein NDU88_008247 [Pleurodeles waltl]|uniref:Uncharacterized protein n=1 Tax=Pleurodeles waltl TaxID=8319 RepID=A0AAV7RSG3_PLEWA|nr:hypothetical protein NDU88_008247 [Pleurodeles waltl]
MCYGEKQGTGAKVGHTMDKYNMLKSATSTGGLVANLHTADDPSLSAIMAAIQDLKGTIEPKLDAVTEDITLLQTDFKKITEKVTAAESHINFYVATVYD